MQVDKKPVHIPVLLKEIIDLFQPKNGDRLLDCTLGGGGHAKAFLEASDPDSTVVGLDADPKVLDQAKTNLSSYHHRVTYICANFANLKDSLTGGGILKGEQSTFKNPPGRINKGFTHILFDLGIGSHQIADKTRGFSFQGETSLSMRYGLSPQLPDSELPEINRLTKGINRYPEVYDLINGLKINQLAKVIRHYGEEKHALLIARSIKSAQRQIQTPADLANVISKAYPKNKRSYTRPRIHPATRTFMAFRLAVNRELECLTAALPQALSVLEPGGILAVISFHSLEDRITKHYFKKASRDNSDLIILTKKPIRPSPDEIKANPRSRSAKLRVIQANNSVNPP